MLYLDSDYINKDGKIIERDKLSYISRGSNASVWKYQVDDTLDSMALKTFFPWTRKYCLNLKVYERMKDLPLKNIIVPKDIYYRLDNSSLSDEDFDAYLMNYIEKENKNLLSDISLEHLLQNIASLEDDINILTEHNILMDDIKFKNSIICSRDLQLYITDIDMFSCVDSTKLSDVDIFYSDYKTRKFNNLRENRYMLLLLIEYHFINDIGSILSKEKKASIENFLYTYFSFDNLGNESITNHVEKLFQGYDSPKEYFIKR